jgi:hypothetical protein
VRPASCRGVAAAQGQAGHTGSCYVSQLQRAGPRLPASCTGTVGARQLAEGRTVAASQQRVILLLQPWLKRILVVCAAGWPGYGNVSVPPPGCARAHQGPGTSTHCAVFHGRFFNTALPFYLLWKDWTPSSVKDLVGVGSGPLLSGEATFVVHWKLLRNPTSWLCAPNELCCLLLRRLRGGPSSSWDCSWRGCR